MLKKFSIIIVGLGLCASSALATEAYFEAQMAKGVAALNGGDAGLAQAEFTAALQEHPDDPEALLYLAIAMNRAGDPAAEAALLKALRQSPDNPRINLELGVCYFRQGNHTEATDYFENVLTLSQESELRGVAEKYLAAIHASSSKKRWGATLLGGMQYDSNVPLVADGELAASGVERKDDWRRVVQLGLNADLWRDEQQQLSAGYSFYQTLHLELTDFNLTQNLFDLTYKRRLSPIFTVQANGSFESILLGGDAYMNSYSFSPGCFATLREGMTTGLSYRWRDSSFKNSDLYPDSSDRDGVGHALILSHDQLLSPTLRVRLGYTYEREETRVDAWSSNSHHGKAGVGIALPHDLLLDLSLEAATQKYDDQLGFMMPVRSDKTYSGSASLTWQIMEQLAASAGYHYTSNDSNIDGYTYTRGITSLMLQGRY